VITTKRNTLRRIAIRLTWGYRLKPVFYSDHSGRNTIKVSNSDTYTSGVEKQINILRHLKDSFEEDSSNTEQTWFLFVDDDTFINWRKARSIIEKLNPAFLYSELHDYRIQEKNGNHRILSTRLNYPSLTHGMHGGAGIFLSKKALHDLVSFEIHLDGVENGDVAFSILALENNVELRYLRGLNWNKPSFYGHTNNQILEQISYHYVMPAQMLVIFLKSQKVVTYAASILSRLRRFARLRLIK
jgi:hypothetical protein